MFGVVGFMGRDAAMVVEATKASFSKDKFNNYDINAPPLPWSESTFTGSLKKSLRIGYYCDSPLLTLTPGVRRAMEESVQILKVRYCNLKKRKGSDLICFCRYIPNYKTTQYSLYSDILFFILNN